MRDQGIDVSKLQYCPKCGQIVDKLELRTYGSCEDCYTRIPILSNSRRRARTYFITIKDRRKDA